MNVAGKIVVVTGAASGIGRSLARRFAVEGAAAVVCADRDGDGARKVADEIAAKHAAVRAVGERVDVAVESDVAGLVERTESQVGPIVLFVSNAGILVMGGAEVPNADWDRIWSINVMAHVHAARALVPRMIARGGGYLLNTASAAGLLTQIGSAPYAVTKHAAVAFGEWLSITHGSQGLKVSLLCPQAVRTPMIAGVEEGGVAGVDGVAEPDDVAQAVIEGLADERFLILPHPEVREYFQRKGADYERWIRGMRRLQERFLAPQS